MPGFSSVKALVERINDDGAQTYTSWRKTPTASTAQGFWLDLSMSPGNPAPQYYFTTPLRAVALAQSIDGGIPHGGAVSPAKKFLRRLMVMSISAGAVPLPLVLLDYLMFYTGIDEGVSDSQAMTNSITLPRYPTGEGVQMMAVVVAPHATGGETVTVSYTNSAGVSGRTTTFKMGTQFVNGTILSSAQATSQCFAPFLALQTGDTGVRQIDSVLVNGLGDVGLFAIVLVKPLASIALRTIDAPVERDFLLDGIEMPQIVDDAYLNLIGLTAGSVQNAPLHGDALFTWN